MHWFVNTTDQFRAWQTNELLSSSSSSFKFLLQGQSGVIFIYLQAQHSLQKTQEGFTSLKSGMGTRSVLSSITK